MSIETPQPSGQASQLENDRKKIDSETFQLRYGSDEVTFDQISDMPRSLIVNALLRGGYPRLSREQNQQLAEETLPIVLRWAEDPESGVAEEEFDAFPQHLKSAKAKAEFYTRLEEAFEKRKVRQEKDRREVA